MVPELDSCGGFLFRHYRISAHAVDRYRERVTEDLQQMFEDLDGAYLFESSTISYPFSVTIAKHEQQGGYALLGGKAIFLIMPSSEGTHHVVTILDNWRTKHVKTNRSRRMQTV